MTKDLQIANIVDTVIYPTKAVYETNISLVSYTMNYK